MEHTRILKRVGAVLLAVGLLDIGVMIYCIANRISYSSSFNVLAVVAGIFLMRGSLRAASIVRWLSVFMLSALLAMLIAWPIVQPLALTFTQLRLNPGYSTLAILFTAVLLGLLYWLARELGREPVRAARVDAGRKQQNMRIPAGLGVALVVVGSIFLGFLLGGESAVRAKSMAAEQVGPGYRFHVSSLSIAKNNGGTFISGVVTAWNEASIRQVPVHWEER
jgi:hypothetical protein